MEEKKLEDILPGTIAAQDIYDNQQLLLPADATITESAIAILKNHGITKVMTKQPESCGLSAEQIQEIDKRVGEKFQEFSDSPDMQYLANVAKKYLKSRKGCK
jgi:hypothetical protein